MLEASSPLNVSKGLGDDNTNINGEGLARCVGSGIFLSLGVVSYFGLVGEDTVLASGEAEDWMRDSVGGAISIDRKLSRTEIAHATRSTSETTKSFVRAPILLPHENSSLI